MAIAVVTPEIERMNRLLQDSYGIDTESGQPMWRIVFSDDQYEKRLSKYTTSGVELLFPEVLELPKYQHIRHKWILEQLVLVPISDRATLPTIKKSYECLFTFNNAKTREPLPPNYDVCCFVINLVQMAKGQASSFNVAKYQEDPEKGLKELAAMEEYLWGNETDITDHTQYGSGIFVPSNYSRN